MGSPVVTLRYIQQGDLPTLQHLQQTEPELTRTQDPLSPPPPNPMSYAALVNGELSGFILVDPDVRQKKVVCGWVMLPTYRKTYEVYEQGWKLVRHHLMDFLGYNVIQCLVLAHRTDLRALLELMGFKLDGILRAHTFWKGAHHDECAYSFLRTDSWPGPQPLDK